MDHGAIWMELAICVRGVCCRLFLRRLQGTLPPFLLPALSGLHCERPVMLFVTRACWLLLYQHSPAMTRCELPHLAHGV